MSFTTEKTRLNTAKTDLKAWLTSVGVSVPSNATITQLVQLLERVNVGDDVDLSSITATTATVLSGKKFVNSAGNLVTGTMANNGELAATISTRDQVIELAEGYYSGGSIKITDSEITKIISENIREGVTFLGIPGTYNPIESQNNCVVLTGTPSSTDDAIVVNGLSNIKTIQHIYMAGHNKSPDDKVLGVWGRNLTLSSGGTATVTLHYGELGYYDYVTTKEGSVTATFDGSTLSIPLNGNTGAKDLSYTIIGIPNGGENTSAVFTGTFTPASADDTTTTFMVYDTDKYVEKLSKITGIYIDAPSIVMARGEGLNLIKGGSATVSGTETGNDREAEISQITVCTATFDGVNVTLTFSSESILANNGIIFTIVGE